MQHAQYPLVLFCGACKTSLRCSTCCCCFPCACLLVVVGSYSMSVSLPHTQQHTHSYLQGGAQSYHFQLQLIVALLQAGDMLPQALVVECHLLVDLLLVVHTVLGDMVSSTHGHPKIAYLPDWSVAGAAGVWLPCERPLLAAVPAAGRACLQPAVRRWAPPLYYRMRSSFDLYQLPEHVEWSGVHCVCLQTGATPASCLREIDQCHAGQPEALLHGGSMRVVCFHQLHFEASGDHRWQQRPANAMGMRWCILAVGLQVDCGGACCGRKYLCEKMLESKNYVLGALFAAADVVAPPLRASPRPPRSGTSAIRTCRTKLDGPCCLRRCEGSSDMHCPGVE